MSGFATVLMALVLQTWGASVSAGGGLGVIAPGAVDDGVVPVGAYVDGAVDVRTPWKVKDMPVGLGAWTYGELYPGTAGVLAMELGASLKRKDLGLSLGLGTAYAPTKAAGSWWPSVSVGVTHPLPWGPVPLEGVARLSYLHISDSPSLPVTFLVGVRHTFRRWK